MVVHYNEISELGNNQEVRVILISAEGKGFCAGVDIKELAEDPNLIVGVNRGNYETFEAIHRNSKPVILALHGYVLGGGIGMAGASDIWLPQCTRFGLPEIDRGAMGGGAHLQRMFPVQRFVICILQNLLMLTRRIAWVLQSGWLLEKN